MRLMRNRLTLCAVIGLCYCPSSNADDFSFQAASKTVSGIHQISFSFTCVENSGFHVKVTINADGNKSHYNYIVEHAVPDARGNERTAGRSVFGFNGKRAWQASYGQKSGGIEDAETGPGIGFSNPLMLPFMFLGLSNGGQLLDLSREDLWADVAQQATKVPGNDDQNGDLVTFDFTRKDSGDAVVDRVSFDRRMHWLPVKKEYFSPKTGQRESVTTIDEYTQVEVSGSQFVIPTKVTAVYYDGETGRELDTQILTMDENSLKVNEPIDPEIFEPSFPRDWEIDDLQQARKYAEAIKKLHAENSSVSGGPPLPVPETKRSDGRLLSWVLILFGCGTFAYWFFKLRPA